MQSVPAGRTLQARALFGNAVLHGNPRGAPSRFAQSCIVLSVQSVQGYLQTATQPEPVVRGTILSYHFKLKKKRTNSIQGKSPSVHVRSVGLSLNHTSPQTYNPKTHVPMVLPDTPQTHVVPGTHALVGVVPCTTSTRSTNAQRAAQHMPSLTRFTAPYDGGVEVLVEPPWSKTTCSTW